MFTTPDQLNDLRDDIAATESLLDKAQAHLDDHRYLLTEKEAWHAQAEIDRATFCLETNKVTVRALTAIM